jgi:uncharacterized protein YbjT (DUF2867 family)
MKILLLGATGGVGRAFCQVALDAGHEVGAFVRTEGAALGTDPNPRLFEFVGNILAPATVAAALDAFKPDAVVSALGSRGKETGNLANSMPPLLALLEERGIRRFIYVSSIGVGESMRQFGFIVRLILTAMLGSALREKEPQEKAIMASSLDWTIVRPGGLVDAPVLGTWKVIEDPGQRLKAAQVSRRDLASFMLLELSGRQYVKKAVSLVSK